jgi:hypothetical protein
MADLFGASGVLEQLFLWNAASEVVNAMAGPAMTAITQDENARHPLASLAPDAAAQAVARSMLADGKGRSEAALQGIDSARFELLVTLARQRLDAATLANAATRGIITVGDAEKGAALVGLDKTSLRVLLALQQPRIAPPDLAALVDRGIVAEAQAAAEAYLQGIDAHWFAALRAMQQPRLAPSDLAAAVTRGMVGGQAAEGQAAIQGIDRQWFDVLLALQQPRVAPSDLAALVDRGIVTEHQAAPQAALQGIDGAWFAALRTLGQPRIPPSDLATAVQHNLLPAEAGADEAALQGIDASWFGLLRQLQTVRLQPSDLAEAMLRSYLTQDQAQDQATPQGVTPDMLKVLADLAGDAPGPDQAVAALLRGIIDEHGHGATSTSYDQAIAESRLHNKWGPVLKALGHALLSPPDAASAVIRNFMTRDEGADQAAKAGVSGDLFAVMTHLAGDAPGPQQLAEALRRSLIKRHGKGPDSTSFQQGIAEGRLADKWAPVIEGLAKLWPTPVDALQAALKGQIDPEQGKDLYELLGGDLRFYQWLLNSQGDGPTPLEAAEWATRGIIPWDGIGPDVTSYAQAVKESRFRDKWAAAYRKQIDYVPSPDSVRIMLEIGAIDRDQAAVYWRKSGLTDADITAFLHTAEFDNTAQTRGLAVSEILDLYYSQVIDEATCKELLGLFHVPEHTAGLLISYTLVRRDIAGLNAAVARIRTLVAARKIGVQTARDALARLKVPASTIDGLIAEMELEASISVKVLTQGEITDAYEYAIIDEATALAELEAIGYTPYDAWILLSVKVKGPLPNPPDRRVAPPVGTVIPGTT